MGTSLTLENSTVQGTLVLSGDHSREESFSGSAQLGPALADILSGIDRLGEVIVGIGPGSYTGIRITIATALGLEFAYGCKLWGCPSVLGFAAETYGVIGNARRNSFAVTIVREGLLSSPSALIGPEQVENFLQQIEPVYAVTPIPGWPALEIRYPEAKFLLHRREAYQPLVEPIYLKEPHITSPSAR